MAWILSLSVKVLDGMNGKLSLLFFVSHGMAQLPTRAISMLPVVVNY